MIGTGDFLLPVQVCRSEPQMVQQVILTSMHPGSTLGRGYSRISRSFFAAVMTAALPVFVISIPQHGNIRAGLAAAGPNRDSGIPLEIQSI